MEAQQAITVFALHRDRDRDWVGDIDVARPMYEAVNSEAAQQIHARPNDWPVRSSNVSLRS